MKKHEALDGRPATSDRTGPGQDVGEQHGGEGVKLENQALENSPELPSKIRWL